MDVQEDKTSEPINAWWEEWMRRRRACLEAVDKAERFACAPSDAVSWRLVFDEMHRAAMIVSTMASYAAEMERLARLQDKK